MGVGCLTGQTDLGAILVLFQTGGRENIKESEDGQSVIYSFSSLNFIFIFALDDFLMT